MNQNTKDFEYYNADPLVSFKDVQDENHFRKRIYEILTLNNFMTDADADAVVHALADIKNSVINVYSNILPKLLDNKDLSYDEKKDILWDIREEFREVEYHMTDAKLTDL